MPRPTYCPQCDEPVIQLRDGTDYCEDCGWPDENRAAGLKFYLLQRGDHNDHTLHVFNSPKERADHTKYLIYGPGELCPDDVRGLGLYLEELRDTGSIEFEGDPGLEWFNAQPP